MNAPIRESTTSFPIAGINNLPYLNQFVLDNLKNGTFYGINCDYLTIESEPNNDLHEINIITNAGTIIIPHETYYTFENTLIDEVIHTFIIRNNNRQLTLRIKIPRQNSKPSIVSRFPFSKRTQ